MVGVEVNDGREVAWDLPADAEFLAKARRMVGELLDGWALSGLIENVTLVVTELYANSLVHGEPPITLILRADRRTLRGEITDRGRLRLPATPADLYDEHGGGSRRPLGHRPGAAGHDGLVLPRPRREHMTG